MLKSSWLSLAKEIYLNACGKSSFATKRQLLIPLDKAANMVSMFGTAEYMVHSTR
jgi:hypothetical protein